MPPGGKLLISVFAKYRIINIHTMVSVIIPIFNVSCFIERGLQQILNQTYQDFEIILVDDGSTDDSLIKCQKWERTDSRIRVFHQENQGAGGARNLGIEKSHGKYIYFYDIDDEISPSLLEYNVSIMEKYDYEIICFGYKNIETTFRSETIVTFNQTIVHNNSELRDVFVDEFLLKVNGFPWNKFYRKDFLDKYNLRYEYQRIQQDEVFNLLCYHRVERLYLSPEVLYNYYIYEKGNTRSRFIPDRFDVYKSVIGHFENLKEFWKINDSRFDDYIHKRFYSSVLQCMLFNLLHKDCNWNKSEKQSEINRIMGDRMTIAAFAYADNNIPGIEQKIYRKVCRNKSLIQIRIVYGFFCYLHKLRKILRAV